MARQVFVTGGSGFVGRRLIRELTSRGHPVRALARTRRSADTLRALGAEPVMGDLFDADALAFGVNGSQWVFHCAAAVRQWSRDDSVHHTNVTGTENVIAACEAANTPIRLIHVSTEAVLAGSPRPLVKVDESWPLPATPSGLYPLTKGLAERRINDAVARGLDAVIVRPRLIWGPGDTSVLPKLVEAAKKGRFSWISGGRYPTSTCHIDNVIEGLMLAAERGVPGAIYFITDGPPVEARWFLTSLLATRGIAPPRKSLPRGVAVALAHICEVAWGAIPLPGEPPVTRAVLDLVGTEVSINDELARRTLGYQGRVSVQEGLTALGTTP